MKATASSSKNQEITHNPATALNSHGAGQDETNALQDTESQAGAGRNTANQGKPESELRAAARRKGLTLKELAHRMGVSYRYLSL